MPDTFGISRSGRVLRSFAEHYRIIQGNPLGRIGFWVVALFLVVAIFAPWLAPHDPWEMQFDSEGSFASLRPPSWQFPIGTTHLGYDLFSQLILATRTTLIIGAVSGFISIAIGANVGLVAGYYGGKVDEILMRLTDVLYGMPFLPFVIVLIALFGRKLEFVILAIVLIIWRTSARVIRAQTISIKQRQFITAARARGCSDLRIIYKHILPNVLPLLLLYAAFNIAWSIITEASASFLGFGDADTISWGGMLYELWLSGKTRVAWWWFAAPSLCIVILVTSLVFVSRAYEEIANPRLRKR
ncbi:MAG: ABC transporter permease [Arenicellales bacterium]|jgi:peptide/nickel transport system permease protein|nr:ABC transporter permease [Arenicellales bacterium]MDP6919407.1 ABC transporter permease [Arenicellales bacterium]